MTVYVLCEGPTEETFINRVLSSEFVSLNKYLIPIVITNKRTASQKYKGGVSSYAKLKREITSLCKQLPDNLITTFIDYYGLPSDTPGMNNRCVDLYGKIAKIEQAVENDVSMPNFCCYLNVHEFEGLLFSDADAFGLIMPDKNVAQLKKIRASFDNPEYINNSYDTAPSRRIIRIYPKYSKITNGIMVASAIGLKKMTEECPHFRQWIDKLRNV